MDNSCASIVLGEGETSAVVQLTCKPHLMLFTVLSASAQALEVQFSADNVNWNTVFTFSAPVAEGATSVRGVRGPFVRLVRATPANEVVMLKMETFRR